MNHVICLGALSLILLGGCPRPASEAGSAVTAVITASATHGKPPLPVSVSGAASSSRNGGDLQFAWDFGGEAQADTVTADHTFTSPGLYTIILRVKDQKGEEGVASVDVRLAGATPTAVIKTDTNSGPVPLVVRFDGTGSSAPDDTIRDYEWDFGDGSPRSGLVAPWHVFQAEGQYTITLTVTTGGGVAASTTTTISAGATGGGSLQFDGTQLAALPIGSDAALTTWTFEAWFKATTDGGTLASIGNGALLLEIRPKDNLIRFQIAGQSTEATATNLAGAWKHVALTSDASAVALYLGGSGLKTGAAAGAVAGTQITVGEGFSGKIAEVRFWSVARSAAQIGGNYDRRLTTTPAELLGYWRFDEGKDQTLNNRAGSQTPGTRGATSAAESDDPAWSTDAPPVK